MQETAIVFPIIWVRKFSDHPFSSATLILKAPSKPLVECTYLHVQPETSGRNHSFRNLHLATTWPTATLICISSTSADSLMKFIQKHLHIIIIINFLCLVQLMLSSQFFLVHVAWFLYLDICPLVCHWCSFSPMQWWCPTSYKLMYKSHCLKWGPNVTIKWSSYRFLVDNWL